MDIKSDDLLITDKYGRYLPLMEDDNGQTYAPVVFENGELIPKWTNKSVLPAEKLKFTEPILKEFETYMYYKATKFINKNISRSMQIEKSFVDECIKSISSKSFDRTSPQVMSKTNKPDSPYDSRRQTRRSNGCSTTLQRSKSLNRIKTDSDTARHSPEMVSHKPNFYTGKNRLQRSFASAADTDKRSKQQTAEIQPLQSIDPTRVTKIDTEKRKQSMSPRQKSTSPTVKLPSYAYANADITSAEKRKQLSPILKSTLTTVKLPSNAYANADVTSAEKRKQTSPSPKATLQTVELPLDAYTDVVILDFVDNTKAWVYLKSNSYTWQEINTNTDNEVSTGKQILDIKTGMICAAQFEDMWYRAEVLNVKPRRIQFIDFGNIDTNPHTELRYLSDRLSSIPRQAVKICFDFNAAHNLEISQTLNVLTVKKDEDGLYSVKVDDVIRSAKENEQPVKTKAPEMTKNCSPTLTEEIINCRLSIADSVKLCGTADCTTFISSNQFVLTVLPDDSFEKELEALLYLEQIKSEKPGLAYNADIGDIITVENADNELVRGVVLNKSNSEYEIGLVDFGTIIRAKHVYKISDEMSRVMELSCMATVSEDEMIKIKKLNYAIPCEVKGSRNILLKPLNIVVSVSPWIPSKPNICLPILPKIQTVYTNLPPIHKIKNKDIVAVRFLHNTMLYIRNKDRFLMLKEITNVLSKITMQKLEKMPVHGQVVLVPSENGSYVRAKIVDLQGDVAEVQYVDTVTTTNKRVTVDALRNLNDVLATFPPTISQFKLVDFKESSFTKDETKTITQFIESNKKFTLTYSDEEDDAGDLLTESNESVCDLLSNLPAMDQKYYFSDITVMEMEVGPTTLKCLNTSTIDQGLVAFSVVNSLSDKISKDIENDIAEYVAKGKLEPYTPQMEEICLVEHEDKWYRACAFSISDIMHELYLLDVGLSLKTYSRKIRCGCKKITKYPAVAIACSIDGLPEPLTEKMCAKLETLIKPNTKYDVKVLCSNDETCSISMPDIIKQLYN